MPPQKLLSFPRRSPRSRPPLRELGAFARCLFVLGGLLVPLTASSRVCAAPTAAVIEIDPAAETILDARAVRRQVSLEVADIQIPSSGANPPPLFVRVLGRDDRQVEVELWARGELSDRRLVSGAESGQHLLVRRVALAAAELARRLRQKRLAAERLHRRQMVELRAFAERNARRTLEGPFALRAEYQGLYSRDIWLLGPSLSAEVSLRRNLRIDLGSRFFAGFEPGALTRLGWFEVSGGPAIRVHPTAALDLDFSALAAAALVHVSGTNEVDAIPSEHETWSARAGLSVRLEPRLTRWLRLSVGAEGGLVLRPIPVRFADGHHERLGGFYLGGALGVVITPR